MPQCLLARFFFPISLIIFVIVVFVFREIRREMRLKKKCILISLFVSFPFFLFYFFLKPNCEFPFPGNQAGILGV